MAAGVFTAATLEVELTAGTWTDISADVDWSVGAQVHRYRRTAFEDIAPATLSVQLLNHLGTYTPDNPLSALYPNLLEDKGLRFTVTKGSASRRFTGNIDGLAPVFPGRGLSSAKLQLTASDVLARCARKQLGSDWLEQVLFQGTTTFCDIWPFNDDAQATTPRNAGTGNPQPGYTVLDSAGSIAFSTDASDSLRVEGAADFSNSGSRVLVLPIQAGTEVFQLFFKSSQVFTASGYGIVAEFYSGSNMLLGQIRMMESGGSNDIIAYDGSGGFLAIILGAVNDGQWRPIRVLQNAGTATHSDITVYLPDLSGSQGVTDLAIDLTAARWVVLGGSMNPSKKKISQQLVCTIAGPATVGDRTRPPFYGYAMKKWRGVTANRVLDYTGYGSTRGIFSGATATVLGSRSTQVAIVTPQGTNLAEALQRLARTTGGVIYADPSNALTYRLPDACRPTTPALTITLEDDDDSTRFEWSRNVTDRPTRATASSPSGDVTYADTARESTGAARDDSFTVDAVSVTAALDAAAFAVNQGAGLRLAGITVDLVNARNDLFAAVWALQPTDRIRVTNLPTAAFGRTYVDLYAQGWTESYSVAGGRASAMVEFDTTAADSPAAGIWNTSRFAAADGDLVSGQVLTSGGTSVEIVPVRNSIAVMSTSSGDYPLDVGIGGERITLPAVPSTSTRTNRVTNPSIETATTGYSGSPYAGVATISASTTQKYVGSQSLKVVWPTAASNGSAVQYALATTNGQPYVFSAWVYVESGPAVAISFDLFGGGTGISHSPQTTGTSSGGWVRLVVFGTASAATTFFGFATAGASTAGQVCYVDASMVEQSALLRPYFDGDNGGAWTGTAHASTSTQTVQTFAGCTRGVAPSIARAHAAGDPTNVWTPGTWSM